MERETASLKNAEVQNLLQQRRLDPAFQNDFPTQAQPVHRQACQRTISAARTPEKELLRGKGDLFPNEADLGRQRQSLYKAEANIRRAVRELQRRSEPLAKRRYVAGGGVVQVNQRQVPQTEFHDMPIFRHA
jgi:hypothetical protein